jgi:hypothetical protein
MAVITSGCESISISPSLGKKMILIRTPATADSGDTINVTSPAATDGETLSRIDWVIGWDKTSGDSVTVTESSGTITIDAAGSTTDHEYAILLIGEA